MKIAKWGNSLAVRIPKDVVDAMGLKENDEIGLVPTGVKGTLRVVRMTREEALREIGQFRGRMPADYKFDREEANSRGPGFSESE